MSNAARKPSAAKSGRFEIRLQPASKKRVETAAQLSGVRLSEFTRNSLIKSAEAIIAAHERTQLAPVDHAAFFAAIENPKVTPALSEAMARHTAEVESL